MEPSAPLPPSVDVTVVLPVRNEGAHIEAILGDLCRQTLGALALEILVVDGESVDDTRARAERAAAADARIRVLDNPGRLSSRARALGSQEARGRFVAFVDGHCRIESPTLLSDMVSLFERTGADVLARPQPLMPQVASPKARAIAAARTSPFGHSLASTIYETSERAVPAASAGAMYRREVFSRIGNFDPSFDACEDVEFNWRCDQAGLSCWTSPALAIAYEPRRTLRALFQQMRRYGLGRARLHAKHAAARSLESLVPVAFVLGTPLLLLAILLLPTPWRWMAAAPLALYLLLTIVASLAALPRAGLRALPWLVAAFPTIHVGLGWGYLKGMRRKSPQANAEAKA